MSATRAQFVRQRVLPSVVLCIVSTVMLGSVPAFAQDRWTPEQQEVVDARGCTNSRDDYCGARENGRSLASGRPSSTDSSGHNRCWLGPMSQTTRR